MSYYNITKNPIPFYELQGTVWTNTKPLWHMNNCSGSFQGLQLRTGIRYFQIPVGQTITSIIQVTQINLRTVSDNNVVALNFFRKMLIDGNGDHYVLLWAEFGQDQLNGQYYISVETEDLYYYSETFCIVNAIDDQLILNWKSTCGKVGSLVYDSQFQNSIAIDAVVVPLEPEIEETISENGFGDNTPTLQVLRQGYSFSMVIPNFLAQAVSAIQLHNNFSVGINGIDSELEIFSNDFKTFVANLTPENDGCHSFCEVTFVRETIVKSACCDEVLAIAEFTPFTVWNDTQNDDDRTCQYSDEGSCNQIITLTQSIQDAVSYIAQIKYEDGGWIDVSESSDSSPVEMNVEYGYDDYYFRFRVITSDNIIYFSKELKLTITNN